MNPATAPLVSVVTPVYNGARHLAECIESVIAQTYAEWEYIIVDNCSTDGTGEIARSYAARDSRIRVVTPATHLSMLANWNFAMRQIAPGSTYVKVAHADDMLMPECLARMVGVAETHPRVGIVGAYRLNGGELDLAGLPRNQDVFDGRSICRSVLLDGVQVFGSPTSTLIRADFVRREANFYNEANLHADTEACYRILREADFGFVHTPLTNSRKHAEQVSTFAKRYNTYVLGNLHDLMAYGPAYLSQDEYQQRLDAKLDYYYRYLAQELLRRRERAFWEYHRTGLRQLGTPLDTARLLRTAAALVLVAARYRGKLLRSRFAGRALG